MRVVVGIDQSNTFCGLATISSIGGAKPPRLEDLTGCHAEGTERVDETAAAVADWVRGRTLVDEVRLERAPITARGDVHHGPQAKIGWDLGLLAGEICGRLRACDYRVQLVDVSSWRERMILWSCRWGVPASPPPKDPPKWLPAEKPRRRHVDRGEGKSFLVTFDGCNHQHLVADFDALVSFSATQCPACQGEEIRKVADPAEWRRAEWKRLACRLVAAHWPDPYFTMVAATLARARTEKEDHELVGVSDACEAVWIAVSALGL